jgi:ketosteroid isomerase-like protein
MSTEKNIQTVKDFFAVIDRGDREGLLALVAEDIEWIIPGEEWPMAGTHRGTYLQSRSPGPSVTDKRFIGRRSL